MPKGYKRNKAFRTLSHSFIKKPLPKISKKPETFVSNPIFKTSCKLGRGNDGYFLTGLWLSFMVGLAYGQDLSRLIDEELEQLSAGNEGSQRSICKSQPQNSPTLVFSNHARASVRPGLYMIKRDEPASVEKWAARTAQLEKLFEHDDLNGDLDFLELMNTNHAVEVLKVDPEGSFAKLDVHFEHAKEDVRFAHDVAMDYLENFVLPSPIQQFSIEDLETVLARLNFLIIPKRERNQKNVLNEKSLYRGNGMMIYKITGFPGFDKPLLAINYFKERDPDFLNAVLQLIDLIYDFGNDKTELLRSEPEKLYKMIASNNPIVQDLIKKYITFAPSYNDVPKLMQNFLQTLIKMLNERNNDPIKIAAFAHMELVRIHPFVDANGRTARALMNTILIQHKLPAIGFLRKKEYMEAVSEAADTRNDQIFEKLLSVEVENAHHEPSKTIIAEIPKRMDECLKKCSHLCVRSCEHELQEIMANIEKRSRAKVSIH